MPYHKVQDHAACPTSKPWAVVKDSDGDVMGCHASEDEADDQLAALYAAEEPEKEGAKMSDGKAGIIVSVQRGLIEAFAALGEGISRFLELIGPEQERATEGWDGSPSRWESTKEYCDACLINVNSEAGMTNSDEWTQSHCMLPVKNPGSDSYDFAGIQAAAGGHGVTQVEKPDDVPQEEWDAAKKKAANTIISQYEENDAQAPDGVYEVAGKEPPKEDARMLRDAARATNLFNLTQLVDGKLWEMPEWPWLLGLYLEDDGSLFAVASAGGKLYRFSVEPGADGEVTLGEFEQVMEEFVPVSSAETRTSVFRDASGEWRWLSISCTAVLNRVGEIDSRALFDSFIAHAEETGEYPYRTFYHCGEALKYGQCDLLAREGYVLITGGIFDVDGPNGEIARAEIAARQAKPDEWGESIGYIPTAMPEMVEIAQDITVPVFNSGVCREISALPEAEAAALFTFSSSQEVSRMNDRIKKALSKLGLSDDYIAETEERVDATNRAVEDEGLIAREQAPEEAPAEKPDEGPALEDEEEEIVVDDETLEAIADRVAAQFQKLFDPLSEAVKALGEAVEAQREVDETARGLLDERLVALEQDDDAKRRQWLEDSPRRRTSRVTYRPRQAHAQEPEQPEGEGEPDYAEQAKEVVSAIPTAY